MALVLVVQKGCSGPLRQTKFGLKVGVNRKGEKYNTSLKNVRRGFTLIR